MADPTGLAQVLIDKWAALTKELDTKLAARNRTSVRAAVEAVNLTADPVAVAPWSRDRWEPAVLTTDGGGGVVPVSVAHVVPMVRLAVRTPIQGDYDVLRGDLDRLARDATGALDRLAVTGVAGTPGVAAVIGAEVVNTLDLAVKKVDREGLVVLYGAAGLGDDAKEAIAEKVGAGDPIHCDWLASADAPEYLLLAHDRIQLSVAQDWKLSYLARDLDAQLVLTFIGTFRARDRAGAAFKSITGASG